jgi:hypothetical protein
VPAPPLADGDPEVATEQDAWARSVEAVAQHFDDGHGDIDDGGDDKYSSEPDRRK